MYIYLRNILIAGPFLFNGVLFDRGIATFTSKIQINIIPLLVDTVTAAKDLTEAGDYVFFPPPFCLLSQKNIWILNSSSERSMSTAWNY